MGRIASRGEKILSFVLLAILLVIIWSVVVYPINLAFKPEVYKKGPYRVGDKIDDRGRGVNVSSESNISSRDGIDGSIITEEGKVRRLDRATGEDVSGEDRTVPYTGGGILGAAILPSSELLSPPQRLLADRIYEKIDGRNVLFLNYGIEFLEWAILRFKGRVYEVSLYYMVDPLASLGAYLEEMPSQSRRLDLSDSGVQYADWSAGLVRFCKGRAYVVILSMEAEDGSDATDPEDSVDSNDIEDSEDVDSYKRKDKIGIELAGFIAGRLKAEGAVSVDVYKLFPENSDGPVRILYNKKDALGLKSLSGSFTAEYVMAGSYYTLIYKVLDENKTGYVSEVGKDQLELIIDEVKGLGGRLIRNDFSDPSRDEKKIILQLFDRTISFLVRDGLLLGVSGDFPPDRMDELEDKLRKYMEYISGAGR